MRVKRAIHVNHLEQCWTHTKYLIKLIKPSCFVVVVVVIVMPHPPLPRWWASAITIPDLEYRTIMIFVVFLKKHV